MSSLWPSTTIYTIQHSPLTWHGQIMTLCRITSWVSKEILNSQCNIYYEKENIYFILVSSVLNQKDFSVIYSILKIFLRNQHCDRASWATFCIPGILCRYQFKSWLLHFPIQLLLLFLGKQLKMAQIIRPLHPLGRPWRSSYIQALIKSSAAIWRQNQQTQDPSFLLSLCTSNFQDKKKES